MVVQILKENKELKLKKGDLYLAKYYKYDLSKVTLISKVTKKNWKMVGKNPMCNQYLSEVKVLKGSIV